MSEKKPNPILVHKAWVVERYAIEFISGSRIEVEYANTISEARGLLAPHYDRCKLKFLNEYVTKDNIPVERSEKDDRFDFGDGEIMTQDEYAKKQQLNKRKEAYKKILEDGTIQYCYIKKYGSYYMDNYCGYTNDKKFAGIYPKETAIEYCDGNADISIEHINVDSHNKIIEEEIAKLQSRIIKNHFGSVEYGEFVYHYECRVAKNDELCLATKDPNKYCNGYYTYSSKDSGSGKEFVIINSTDPVVRKNLLERAFNKNTSNE